MTQLEASLRRVRHISSHIAAASVAEMRSRIVLQPEVASALARGDAVVALESTIISHGMPYPQNVRTAREVEATVRAGGAVPATIAILDGIVHVGLDDAGLEKLGQLGEKCYKVSRQNLAVVLGARANGATTVSGTMMIAARAGIKVFVTGGIGGVHRGVESTMDISADLTELGRTAVAVVCAGVKSILDIPRTLEYLETEGVSVLGWKTEEFPAFFTSKSGLKVQPGCNMNSAQDVAQVMVANRDYRIGSGLLVGVPIPAEFDAGNSLEEAVDQAVRESVEQGVVGAKITPFLLARVNELTGGNSLTSNIALVKHNAQVGASIAVAYAEHAKRRASQPVEAPTVGPSSRIQVSGGPDLSTGEGGPLVIGGVALDAIARPNNGIKLVMESSTPGVVEMSVGGVGGNIARAMGTLGAPVLLVSAVGDDSAGQHIRQTCEAQGMETAGLLQCSKTAVYHAVTNEAGDLVAAVADMDSIKELTPERLEPFKARIAGSTFVVMDGNIPAETIEYVCSTAHQAGVPVWFEPTSVAKSVKILQGDALQYTTVISPNKDEVLAMAWALRERNSKMQDQPNQDSGLISNLLRVIGRTARTNEDSKEGNYLYRRMEQNAPVRDNIQEVADLTDVTPRTSSHHEVIGGSGWTETSQEKSQVIAATVELLEAGVEHVVVTLGSEGVLLGWIQQDLGSNTPRVTRLKHIPAIPVQKVVNVTGAGDCLVAGTIFSLLYSNIAAEDWREARLNGKGLMANEAVQRAIQAGGLLCARCAVENQASVPAALRDVVEQ